MSQDKQTLEDFYSNEDPWGYKVNPDDHRRKEIILDALNPFAPFKQALDLGAGEGWITQDLPATKKFAYELSDVAAKRLPSNVKRVTNPEGKYDLIIATGVLYPQYDYRALLDMIKSHADGVVLTCHIKDWEVNNLPNDRVVHTFEFPYRTYTQRLVVYKW